MSPTGSDLGSWRAEDLWEDLQSRVPDGGAGEDGPQGLSVEIAAELDSTNARLLERVRAGVIDPQLLVAERQTAGRGRLGRAWHAQPGASLTFSLSWPLLPVRDGRWDPAAAVPDWSALSLAVGLAVAEALDPAGSTLGLKWPNDLWLRGEDRKLGGILIESVSVPAPAGLAARMPAAGVIPGSGTPLPPVLRVAVIGIGLNLAAEAPPGGDYRTGYAGLQALDPALDGPAVLHRVMPTLVLALQAYAAAGFDAASRAAFARRDVLAGRTCTAGERAGRVLGVAEDGALIMHTAAGEERINSGEVSVRPC